MAAATTDMTTNSYPGSWTIEKTGIQAIQTKARLIDCVNYPIAASAVVKLFSIPKGAVLLRGYTVSVTAQATVTFAIGNATTANTYRAAAIIGAAGTTVALTNVLASNTIFAAAADEIQMTVAAATPSTAKFWIVIEYIPSDVKSA